jgi:hypothetical protein
LASAPIRRAILDASLTILLPLAGGLAAALPMLDVILEQDLNVLREGLTDSLCVWPSVPEGEKGCLQQTMTWWQSLQWTS